MNRWSVRRIFRNATADDFRQAVRNVQDNMAEVCGCPIDVNVKFYSALKHSITKYDPDLMDWLAEQNAQKVFAEANAVDDITDESWLKAAFVEATLRPADEEKAPRYTFGQVEARGTSGKQMTFYVQPEEVGAPVRNASLKLFRNWRKGDGYDSNHIVTFS